MAAAMTTLQLEMKTWRSEERFRLDSKIFIMVCGR